MKDRAKIQDRGFTFPESGGRRTKPESLVKPSRRRRRLSSLSLTAFLLCLITICFSLSALQAEGAGEVGKFATVSGTVDTMREGKPPAVPAKVTLNVADGIELASVELDLIRQALEKTGWNITQAARMLGVSRDTLRYRMERHRITRGA